MKCDETGQCFTGAVRLNVENAPQARGMQRGLATGPCQMRAVLQDTFADSSEVPDLSLTACTRPLSNTIVRLCFDRYRASRTLAVLSNPLNTVGIPRFFTSNSSSAAHFCDRLAYSPDEGFRTRKYYAVQNV